MTCDHIRMRFSDFLIRTLLVLLIGGVTLPPFAVSSAAAGAMAHSHAMSSGMVMDTTAANTDEMPCHKNSSDKEKHCPFMAVCTMLCCQAIAASHLSLAAPANLSSRLVPAELAQIDGINFRPPPRPPKA
jgi:hypothetical protein